MHYISNLLCSTWHFCSCKYPYCGLLGWVTVQFDSWGHIMPASSDFTKKQKVHICQTTACCHNPKNHSMKLTVLELWLFKPNTLPCNLFDVGELNLCTCCLLVVQKDRCSFLWWLQNKFSCFGTVRSDAITVICFVLLTVLLLEM
jgi:hypothetical protein